MTKALPNNLAFLVHQYQITCVKQHCSICIRWCCVGLSKPWLLFSKTLALSHVR
ncbi:hypothetical protein HanRHA438_Chr15g0683041 [Helianthus annuus]|nr:hypothetical protein HanRHA438_Chr15g0683041 [Helianthus annuus]